MDSFFTGERVISRIVEVGNIKIGGGNPIVLQSMTNTNTLDVDSTINQCARIIENGADLVRITTPTIKEARALGVIKEGLNRIGYNTPIVADIHYSAKVAEIAATIADKIRINPGNYGYSRSKSDLVEDLDVVRKNIQPLVQICNSSGTAIRIGVNHGSLSKRILKQYGNTPEGIVISAMEYVEVFESLGFQDLIVSLKSSNPKIMVYANRLLVEKMIKKNICYPLHIGVTEAGEGEDGRIRSAIGIGALLEEGIGDTIRVSLTEPPENEIPVAKQIIEKFWVKPNIESANKIGKPCAYFSFQRRTSNAIHNIGGVNPPSVILNENNLKNNKYKSLNPDYVYNYLKNQLVGYKANTGKISFTELINDEFRKTGLSLDDSIAIVFHGNEKTYVQNARLFFANLKRLNIKNPVILKVDVKGNSTINTAIDLGSLLIDGLGDAIWLETSESQIKEELNSLSYSILQSCGARISKTEYISCPTCGRTLFDIESTLKNVKSKTNHLKGLKIAVMGCIVNGPGEMADADYGYVGAGSKLVNLYRGKEVVKRNINQGNALDELIKLIKSDGRWCERQ